MSDSNYGAQKPLYIEAALEQDTSRAAQGWHRLCEFWTSEIVELDIVGEDSAEIEAIQSYPSYYVFRETP